MALNESSLKKLNSELSSCKNLIDLIKLTNLVNDFTPIKLFKLISIIVFSIILSVFLCYTTNFNELIATLTDSGLTISIGLIALIIAGYSIVMGSLSNDNIYYLLLNTEKIKNKTLSVYSSTIIKCTEPLIWFILLLIFSVTFKITYLLKDLIKLEVMNSVPFIKVFVIATLIFFIIIAINSLVYFIINMYNVLTANARFELLHRHAKNTGNSFDLILNRFEDNLNNEKEE